MLQKPHTGEVISSKKVECRGAEEIPSKVDELTNEIKLDLNISREQIASDIDKEVGKITTNSPEAYKYYLEGRKYHNIGENRKSIPFMEKAVAIDPEFAMAYRSMAVAYGNLGYGSEDRKYIQKAFELTDRLSDRERYQIQGDFYRRSEKTYDKAIEAYNKLLELYPKDRTGNINLGMLYINLEQWDKVIERNEVLIQDRDETYFPYLNMSPPYQAQGMYDKYREVLEYYLNNFSDSAPIRWALADNYIYQGKYNLAFVELNKALSLSPDPYMIRTKGDIYLCKGDLIEAEKEYQKLLESEERMARLSGKRGLAGLYLLQGKFEKSKEQANQGIELAKKLGMKGMERGFHFFLGYLHLGQKNSEEALDEFNKALSSAVEAESLGAQRWALYWKGQTYLQMKSPDKALRTADELKELIEKGIHRKAIRMYEYLIGMIELKRDNFPKAIEYIKKGLSLDEYAPPAVFLDSLALSYYKSEDLDKAQAEYKRLTSLKYDKIYWPDIYVKSFYMLGKIYEQKGWKGKAIEHCEKFLSLWKDADPGIPEVEDARERLAKLKE
jgi:tetratricopeptide (TPR) repeat protein